MMPRNIAGIFGELAILLLTGSGALLAAEPSEFDGKVAPVLIRHCVSCHNPGDLAGGLNLQQLDAAQTGGDSGEPAFAAGNSAESAIIARIEAGEMPPEGKGAPVSAEELAALKQWIDAGAHWPEGRVLSPFEFTTDVRAGLDWWSLKPPVRPQVPDVPQAAVPLRTPIDHFIAHRLGASNLQMTPEADRATLIRRAMLDLHGLPPTPEEVQEFVADPDPAAYEKLVDRLLASPRYGERWARHWLDVVRFAESTGFETNVTRPNAWPYRDYVIQSFNDDKPYSQFVIEQLAGDQVGSPVGTGFLVAGPNDQVGSPDIELTRMQRLGELDDMVSTTSMAFLGLTVGCAKCHDHKFDPIAQVDYFSMQAMFAGVRHGDREVDLNLSKGELASRTELQSKLAEAQQARLALVSQLQPLASVVPAGQEVAQNRPPVHALGNIDRFAPVMAKYVRFTILRTNIAEPCIDELEVFSADASPRNVALASAGAVAKASGTYADGALEIHKLEHVNDGVYGNSRSWISNASGTGWLEIELPRPIMIDRIAWARDHEGTFSDRLPVEYLVEVALEPGVWQIVASGADRRPYRADAPPERLDPAALPKEQAEEYARLEKEIQSINTRLAQLMPQRAYVGNFGEPNEPIYRLHRGEVMQRREEIDPAAIASVGTSLQLPASTPEAQRRLALGKWIADESNPLTARVMVNRIWHHHFGQGLMVNPSDFGFNGGVPSHPELLDWLATEFMQNGWRPKHIHRLIMLSSAYRQGSQYNETAAAVDGRNQLLWRFARRRLEAEAIRDTILSVAGSLDLTMGGPGFDLFEPNSNYVKVYKPKEKFGPAEFRRMVYQQKPRMQPDGTFGVFDCPDSAQSLAKRNSSTTALQALNLMNSSFLVQQAQMFAERLTREAPADTASQIQHAFWLAFGRAPAEEELQAAQALVASASLEAFCRALLNSNELIFID